MKFLYNFLLNQTIHNYWKEISKRLNTLQIKNKENKASTSNGNKEI
jgi:hypothetical protein